MHLLHHDQVLKSYSVGLGFAPAEHKAFEGDGRTPEGEYRIDRRNPNSEFHLSIGISYPNNQDREFARSIGKSQGGVISLFTAVLGRTERVGATGQQVVSP